MFGKRNQLVGLDVGTHSIKVVELEDSAKGLILKKVAKQILPPDLFKDGEPEDPVHLSMIIKDVFSKNRINNKNVAISIGGYSAIVKTINLPIREDVSIQKQVFDEAEHYIPFDISEVNIDYQVMGAHEQNPNQQSVLLVAAKKEMIQKYVSITENAGLNPIVMDVDSFAVQNIFERNEPDIEEAVLVNVGANKISLNVISKGRSIFIREVAIGSRQITKEIKVLDPEISDEDAEKLKQGVIKSEKIDDSSMDQIIASVSSDWCTEIARALDFFYSNYFGERVQKVFISGGGSHIERFKEDLSSHIDAQVLQLMPFQVIHTDKSGVTEDELMAMGPELCVALGLGLRKVDDK
jgi:type IV pilus assembly protein PilM